MQIQRARRKAMMVPDMQPYWVVTGRTAVKNKPKNGPAKVEMMLRVNSVGKTRTVHHSTKHTFFRKLDEK